MVLRLSAFDLVSGQSSVQSWVLDANDSTTVEELAQSLELSPFVISPNGDAQQPAIEVGLLNGAILPQWSPSQLVPGQLRLEVVGGPFAGETIGATEGASIRIGSSAAADLCIADPYVAGHHATITVIRPIGPDGTPAPLRAVVQVENSEFPVYVNGERATGTIEIVPVDLLQIGGSVLRIGIEPGANADLARDELGMRAFNRPSRIQPRRQTPVLVLPNDPPEDQDKTPLPWLSAVIPVVLGVTMAIIFARPVMLMMAAASPIMVVGTFLVNRKQAMRKGQKTISQWRQEVKDARANLVRLVREQRIDNWYRSPDPVVIRDIATRPLARLWERRRVDPDALHVRVGVAETPLDVRFEGGGSKDRTAERNVGVSPSPVSIDLAEGVVGIAGPEDVTRSTVRSMLCSLATLRSPLDTQIVLLCDEALAHEWSWVQWLPHAQAGKSIVALIGNTDETRRERLKTLRTILEARSRAATERGGATFDTSIVVVIDGARRYRTLQGMAQLLEQGAKLGIHIVAIDSDRSRLPEEASTVIEVDAEDRSLARVETQGRYYARVLLDGTTLPAAEGIARSLCSINHVSGIGDEALLPTKVRMVDLIGVDLEQAAGLAERWTKHPRGTHVVVGADAEGRFALDIASQGPHALIAGTTGAGKSEFLKTFVVSLALNNRPDALNFVLVDYKGGSALADCVRLPHTVGLVTNLDARETERALVSLDAEIKRRERIITGEFGVKDLDAAWAKDPAAAAAAGLARLMIVIDEFAELKSELPEFIDGLVRIARVGRSLGLHLVLATQRPSGVVTPEMQSNISLRVALRVADRSDSMDILGSTDAAMIGVATPGRAFVRAEAGGAPIPFQTANVGGIRLGVQRTRKLPPAVAPVDWLVSGQPPRFPSVGGKAERGSQDDTDLKALVALINNATRLLDIKKNQSPWLLPLPTTLRVDHLQLPQDASPTSVVLGLRDLPDQQLQEPLLWDYARETHLAFVGGARSGRTSAIRTILGQLVETTSPNDMHMYVLDFAGGALLPLAAADHCGAVVTALDVERLPRLMTRLIDELATRQGVLTSGQFPSILEQRATGAVDALPFVVVAVDGWERAQSQVTPEEGIALRDQMMRLLREGPSVGIRVLLTGDRSFPGDKISGHFEATYVLPFRDINDYRAAGIMIKTVPEGMPAGRALVGSEGREIQLALLNADASPEAQAQAFRSLADSARSLSAGGQAPFHVDAVPQHYALSKALELPLAPHCVADGPVVAVGGDTLSRFTIEWPEVGGFVVIGDRLTGKSSALAAITTQLSWRSEPMVVVATRTSVLTELATQLELPIISDPATMSNDLEKVLDALPEGRITVIVDDAETIKDGFLEQGLMGLRARLSFIVAADTQSIQRMHSGPFVAAKAGQLGVILSPTVAQQASPAFGQNIPRTLLGKRQRGGGLLFINGEFRQVQIPDVQQ